jgi:hypothetical protein
MAENGKLPASDLAPIYKGQLAKAPAAGWNAMNVEARSLGLELHPTGSDSSYRSYDRQVYYWNLYQSGKGNLAAKPGTSNHGWGTAVDIATQEMRSMVDRIGAKYGWSKSWSDAPSEWWHLLYQSGHYSGPDPGPEGKPTPPKPPPNTRDLYTVVKADGRLEVFVEDDTGTVWHTWQTAVNGGWAQSWQKMGTP